MTIKSYIRKQEAREKRLKEKFEQEKEIIEERIFRASIIEENLELTKSFPYTPAGHLQLSLYNRHYPDNSRIDPVIREVCRIYRIIKETEEELSKKIYSRLLNEELYFLLSRYAGRTIYDLTSKIEGRKMKKEEYNKIRRGEHPEIIKVKANIEKSVESPEIVKKSPEKLPYGEHYLAWLRRFKKAQERESAIPHYECKANEGEFPMLPF